jgi:hypothetical protein
MANYPRPDFLREELTWTSLNGPWSFLFDDNDVGLTQGWHLTDLPDEITVNPTNRETSSRTHILCTKKEIYRYHMCSRAPLLASTSRAYMKYCGIRVRLKMYAPWNKR